MNVTHFATSFIPDLVPVAVFPAFLRYGFSMTVEYLTQNWALVIASVLGIAVLLFVLFRLIQDSARGRLSATVGQLRDREKAARAAGKAVDKAVGRLDRMLAKADSAIPRKVEEAREALEEAQEIQKLVDDQVLVVRNDVRLLILEDYPAKRHEAMRYKYLTERK